MDISGKVLIRSIELADPWDIALNDSLIYIGNKNTRPMLESYTLKGERRARYVLEGNDIMGKGIIGRMNIVDNRLVISDLFSGKVFALNESMIGLENLSSIKVTDKNLLLSQDLIICSSEEHMKGRITIYNRKNNAYQQSLLSLPTKYNDSISEAMNLSIYSSLIEISPNQKIVVAATINADMLDVVNLENNEHFNYHYSKPESVIFDEIRGIPVYYFTSKSKMGYTDLAVTDNYVYGLYSGKSMEEKSASSVIRVISTDGKHAYTLNTDKQIKRIAVAKDNKAIYAITINENNTPEVVKFDISLI
ncbi:BF3164 family lipoprotein [Sphingobacterium kitahiroshimense]|uniref:BF3164 family lipoprotein n=1 Tax=Sphingobacterium kitahiroshimense TaxID=470446 RepID=UPI003208982B